MRRIAKFRASHFPSSTNFGMLKSFQTTAHRGSSRISMRHCPRRRTFVFMPPMLGPSGRSGVLSAIHRLPYVHLCVVALVVLHGPLEVAPVQTHHLVVQNICHLFPGYAGAVFVVCPLVGNNGWAPSSRGLSGWTKPLSPKNQKARRSEVMRTSRTHRCCCSCVSIALVRHAFRRGAGTHRIQVVGFNDSQ